MKLEEYIDEASLKEVIFDHTYFKPSIPKDKMLNAINEYAHDLKIEDILILIDETFWGSAKEGLIITNKEIRLSKKLGSKKIALTDINNIEITDGVLSINNKSITKLSNPQVLPLRFLGSVLQEYINGFKNRIIDNIDSNNFISEKQQAEIEALSQYYFSNFEYYSDAFRKDLTHRPSFYVNPNIPNNLKKLVQFRANLAPNEQIIAIHSLGYNNNISFFCITNVAIYQITNDEKKRLPLLAIKNAKFIEEFDESRYVNIRLNGDISLITEVKNGLIKPYSHAFFPEVLKILNS